VRGFDDTSISGDSGGYIKNELGWNLPQFTENKYANFFVGNLQPYIGYDYGMTKLHLGKDSEVGVESGYVSGWATGIRNNSEGLSFDLAYSQAINAPATITTKTGEVYFTVSAKFGF
jgi:hemolysin activation/secretion protein